LCLKPKVTILGGRRGIFFLHGLHMRQVPLELHFELPGPFRTLNWSSLVQGCRRVLGPVSGVEITSKQGWRVACGNVPSKSSFVRAQIITGFWLPAFALVYLQSASVG